MRLNKALSSIAFAALLIAATPTWAQVSLGSGSGGLLNSDGTGIVNLENGAGDSPINVDLGGSPDVTLDLGGANETSATIDLGNSGGGSDISGTIDLLGGAGNDATADVNLGSVTGGGSNSAIVHLFGDGGEGATSANANVLGLGGGETDALITLFGNGGGSPNGGQPPAGGNGNGGPGGGNGPGIFDPDNGNGINLPNTRVAAIGNTGACFTPNAQQMDYLLSRTRASIVAASSNQGRNAGLIPIELCPEARAKLEAAAQANPDMRRLHVAVRGNQVISTKLSDAGYAAGNVLAVERNQANLTVYVY